VSTTAISIVAMVSTGERAALEAARGQIAHALSEVSGTPWKCDCHFVVHPTDLENAAAGTILVTSLVSEVDSDEPWPDAEARLRGVYVRLCERGDPVFICTVLRHVESDDLDVALRRVIRIRRLNLLAAEISRQSGAFVIDIDRALADVGAQRLATDYRLQGAVAPNVAAKAVARDIIVNGLDAFASFDVQNGARSILARHQPTDLPSEIRPQNLILLVQGRRKQLAAIVTDTEQRRVGWLIRQMLKRQIGPMEALDRLIGAVRRNGAKESFATVALEVIRLIREPS
jgi:hypothetical protein